MGYPPYVLLSCTHRRCSLSVNDKAFAEPDFTEPVLHCDIPYIDRSNAAFDTEASRESGPWTHLPATGSLDDAVRGWRSRAVASKPDRLDTEQSLAGGLGQLLKGRTLANASSQSQEAFPLDRFGAFQDLSTNPTKLPTVRLQDVEGDAACYPDMAENSSDLNSDGGFSRPSLCDGYPDSGVALNSSNYTLSDAPNSIQSLEDANMSRFPRPGQIPAQRYHLDALTVPYEAWYDRHGYVNESGPLRRSQSSAGVDCSSFNCRLLGDCDTLDMDAMDVDGMGEMIRLQNDGDRHLETDGTNTTTQPIVIPRKPESRRYRQNIASSFPPTAGFHPRTLPSRPSRQRRGSGLNSRTAASKADQCVLVRSNSKETATDEKPDIPMVYEDGNGGSSLSFTRLKRGCRVGPLSSG